MKIKKVDKTTIIVEFEHLYEAILLMRTTGGVDVIKLDEKSCAMCGYVLKANKIIITTKKENKKNDA